MLLSTLVASTTLAVAAPSRPTGADQVADLKAQAVAVSQQLVEEQLQMDAYQQQYSVISARVAADSSAIVQVGVEIDQDRQQIGAKSAMVRRQAIRSYMDFGSGSSSPDAALFGGGEETAQAASEYSSIAVGNITTALDQLHTAQATLSADQAVLRQQEDRDRSDQSNQAIVLDQANNSTDHLQALQAQVTGQLATAVAAQAASQTAAAEAAVAAAQKATAKPSPTRSPTTTAASVVPVVPTTSGPAPAPTAPVTPPAGSAGVTDPALNAFLQCVVQAESGGDYSINTGNGYFGAFQFSQSTWNIAAQDAGLSYLVGVLPSSATKAEQDTVAVALFALDGDQPWLGDRCS
ncbi:MAG: transglycosylase family protein [Acidimicrobiales bacterium]